jgi:hypothetical protein
MRTKRAFSQEDKIKLLVLVRERRLDKMTIIIILMTTVDKYTRHLLLPLVTIST